MRLNFWSNSNIVIIFFDVNMVSKIILFFLTIFVVSTKLSSAQNILDVMNGKSVDEVHMIRSDVGSTRWGSYIHTYNNTYA